MSTLPTFYNAAQISSLLSSLLSPTVRRTPFCRQQRVTSDLYMKATAMATLEDTARGKPSVDL